MGVEGKHCVKRRWVVGSYGFRRARDLLLRVGAAILGHTWVSDELAGQPRAKPSELRRTVRTLSGSTDPC